MDTPPEWDPLADEVLADPIAAYDALRRRCPVAHSQVLHHSVLRHAEALRVLNDPHTFSSRASRHVAVPNSMDPPEHGAWRALIEPYFGPGPMQAFEPVCRQVCAELVSALPRDSASEIMEALAYPFAVRLQCAFLGWPDALHQPLLDWIHQKNVATRGRDADAVTAVAMTFDRTIRALLKVRRDAGEAAPDDVTTRLMRETVRGQPITDEAVVSILRNWTVGELGTMASSVGILLDYLARHPALQAQLRRHPEQVRPANDEILRMHGPLMVNRRKTTCPVQLGGVLIPEGERVTILWPAVNRDEAVFGDPDEFRLDRDPSLNLLYGAGIHVCPGAPLARLELEVIVQTVLAQVPHFEPAPGTAPVHAHFPAAGYRRVELRLHGD